MNRTLVSNKDYLGLASTENVNNPDKTIAIAAVIIRIICTRCVVNGDAVLN